jgi:hypothetical protein
MNKEKTFEIMSEFENYSTQRIKQVIDWIDVNEDIRWYANSVSEFVDENISEYYINDDYSRKSRWELWNDTLNLLLKNDIKTNLDIGCANNHFSYICNKKGIFSVGIDPRENFVRKCHQTFEKSFGNDYYGYVGNIKTFNEFFGKYDEKLFDCVTVLNFLHGDNHITEEIKTMFTVLEKITTYIVITEPKWDNLGLPKITDKYQFVSYIPNEVATHIVYKLDL